jgi:hypothetical protein
MKYSFTCPAPCNYEIKVDASNDDDAVTKILTEGAKHAKSAHPDLPPPSEEQAKAMVRTRLKKM